MNRIILVAALLLLLLSNGCNDYTVRTVVNPDGSFERTVVCEGDAHGLSAFHLPYVFDSSWTVTTEPKEGNKGTSVTIAKKKFASASQLMEEFVRGKDSSKLAASCRVEKQFRWFFTYFSYSETLPSYAMFRHEAIDSFFTPTEISRLKEKGDSTLNKKVEEFWYRNIIDEFVDRLAEKARQLNDPELPPAIFSSKKSEFYQDLVNGKNDKSQDVVRLVERAVRPHPAKKLRGAIDTAFNEITKEVERESELDFGYKNEVTMPGILITSNSKSIEGNKVSWDCQTNKYFDVTMTAESRMVNVWSVVATAFLGLLLIVGLLLPMVRGPRL